MKLKAMGGLLELVICIAIFLVLSSTGIIQYGFKTYEKAKILKLINQINHRSVFIAESQNKEEEKDGFLDNDIWQKLNITQENTPLGGEYHIYVKNNIWYIAIANKEQKAFIKGKIIDLIIEQNRKTKLDIKIIEDGEIKNLPEKVNYDQRYILCVEIM